MFKRRRSTAAGIAKAAAIGYVLGTIPSADIAAKLHGGQVDLRATGSGNPGGANAKAVLGTKWGIGVMAADIVKGGLASIAGAAVARGPGAHVGGTAAVIGHCFPVWNGFKGGKGVACGVGQVAITFPAYFPFDLAVAGLTSKGPFQSRALATTAVASTTWVAAATVWWRKGWPNLWGPRPTVMLPLAAAASSGVIMYRFATAKTPTQ